MSAQTSNPTPDPTESLFTNFSKLWKSIRNLDNIFGNDLQAEINKIIPKLEVVQKTIDDLDMFSINEEFSDLTTNSLPFILVDGLIGKLYSKKFDQRENRLKYIEASLKSYKSFKYLNLQYDIAKPSNIPNSRTSVKSAQDQMSRRELLIASHKEEKDLKSQIDHFIDRINKQGLDSMDDDFIREKYLVCLKHLYIEIIKDEENLNLELNFMKNPSSRIPQQNTSTKPNNLLKNSKPLILTKNSIQKAVFGAGYPSLPTMTVEEFAEQELAKITPSNEFKVYQQQVENMKIRNKIKCKESKNENYLGRNEENEYDKKRTTFNHETESKLKPDEEEETEESLNKLRRQDEFRDDHRRGEGNRKNMG